MPFLTHNHVQIDSMLRSGFFFRETRSVIVPRFGFFFLDSRIRVKGSYLYENVDDHHERSIHDHKELKYALQNMIISG